MPHHFPVIVYTCMYSQVIYSMDCFSWDKILSHVLAQCAYMCICTYPVEFQSNTFQLAPEGLPGAVSFALLPSCLSHTLPVQKPTLGFREYSIIIIAWLPLPLPLPWSLINTQLVDEECVGLVTPHIHSFTCIALPIWS